MRIQGRASRFVDAIDGSYSNVVGLPVSVVYRLLIGHGWSPSSQTAAFPIEPTRR